MMPRVHIRQHRRGAGPELIILPAGTILLGRIALDLVWPLGQTNLHFLDLADEPVTDEFHGVSKHSCGTLLRAGLKDRLALGYLTMKRLALGEKMGNRFFTVDVLAVPKRLKRLHCMPMVGRGNNHDVDVITGAQIPVVRVSVAGL